jgi:transcriptional regulator with XRE-family HTH domain
MTVQSIAQIVFAKFRQLREGAGITEAQLEEKLILGPGWISQFESGETAPGFDMLLALLHAVGANPSILFEGIEFTELIPTIQRGLYAETDGANLLVHFNYAQFNAKYRLRHATLDEFGEVMQALRSGLAALDRETELEEKATAVKRDAVVNTYLKAVKTWPRANPSDLWWFVVYRAYCDPFNHPARFARLNLDQSWKRTAGWALEQVLCRHYGPYLAQNGVRIFIGSGEEKEHYIRSLKIRERLEADKIDVLLNGITGTDREKCFGAVHVKASFAERRTDDVPMSQALIRAGYTSPLWTMDCKSFPSENPANDGELGVARGTGPDRRSAKRKDIEEDGYFSACFSYNANTIPTPSKQKAKARIYLCNFRNPDDEFSRFILREWQKHRG